MISFHTGTGNARFPAINFASTTGSGLHAAKQLHTDSCRLRPCHSGISPLSKFGRNTGLQVSASWDLVFDSNGPSDFKGTSTNAYLPWVLVRMFGRAPSLASSLFPAWWRGAALTLQRYNLAAKGVASASHLHVLNSPGTFHISRGMPGATLVGYARRDINFAWTLSRTGGPWTIPQVSGLVGGGEASIFAANVLNEMKNRIESFRNNIRDPESWRQIFQSIQAMVN